MSGDQQPESKAWWQTLAGLLTATAAVITAVTGLLVAVHQSGLFRQSAPASTQTASFPATEPTPSSQSAAGATPPAGISPTSRPVPLPQTTEVRFGDAVFQLLAVRVDAYSPDKVSVHFTVRMTNRASYPANFWANSFRLVVDGTPQAPDNDLDELLPANSWKEADVEFVLPSATSIAGLQMGDVGPGKPAISLNLTPR